MSYIRWSIDINNTVPWEEEFEIYQKGGTWEDVKILRNERGGIKSDWYIFWHTNDLPDNKQSLENQLLSIWHITQSGLDTFEYKQVRYMYDADDWSALTCSELTQKEVMRKHVKEWLDEVEGKYT